MRKSNCICWVSSAVPNLRIPFSILLIFALLGIGGGVFAQGPIIIFPPDPPPASTGDPNDPMFENQWGLKNPGLKVLGVQCKAGADIKAEEAWKINPGSEDIIVAVLDGGLNITHPDLAARVWKNSGEIAGNGVDDDKNGYTDDVNGWSFANDDYIENRPGTPDISDGFGHGTMVASIIGAIRDNGIGMAGVARCKLMPVKIFNVSNKGHFSWMAEGIRYAVDNGANVINISGGGVDGNTAAVRREIEYALQKNVTIVAAMMNARSSVPNYPAAFPGVIAVGATSADDHWARVFFNDTTTGSNFGPHISICAPGNFVFGLHQSDPNETRAYGCGTSNAAPYVTGVCALLLAQSPTRKPAEIKQILEKSADDLVGDTVYDTPGFDNYFGHGRLNAKQALTIGIIAQISPRRLARKQMNYSLQKEFDPLGRIISVRRGLQQQISNQTENVTARRVLRWLR